MITKKSTNKTTKKSTFNNQNTLNIDYSNFTLKAMRELGYISATKKFKKIIKKIRNRQVIPHPFLLSFIIENGFIKKPQKAYNKNTFITLIEIQRMISSEMALHEETKDILISKSYIKKAFSFPTEATKFINIFFEKTFQGNSIKKMANSYKLKDILIENGVEIGASTAVYAKKEKIISKIEDTLINFSKQSIENYTKFYNKQKEEPSVLIKKNKKVSKEKNKRAKTIEKLISDIDRNNSTNPETIQYLDYLIISKNTKNVIEKELQKQEFVMGNIKEEILEYYDLRDYYFKKANFGRYKFYDTEIIKLKGQLNQLKRIRNELKNIKNSIQTYNDTYFITFISSDGVKSSRTYNIINRLSKYSRGKIFNGIELDVSNMAFVAIRNKYKDYDLPYFDLYIKERDIILTQLSKKIYRHSKTKKIDNWEKISSNTGDVILIKRFLKTTFLSIILGSNNYSIQYKKIQKAIKTEAQSIKNSDKVVSSMIKILDDEEIIKGIKSDVRKIRGNKEKNILASEFMRIETKIRKKLYSIIKRNVMMDFVYNKNNFEKRIVGIHDGFIIPPAYEVLYSENIITEIKDYLNSISVKVKFSLKGLKKLKKEIKENKNKNIRLYEKIKNNTEKKTELKLKVFSSFIKKLNKNENNKFIKNLSLKLFFYKDLYP